MPREWSPPLFPIDTETFLATVASIAATHGDALMVGILASSDPEIEFEDSRSDWGQDYTYFLLRLTVSPDVYARLAPEKDALCKRLQELANDICTSHYPYSSISTVALAPSLLPSDGWRQHAAAWLRGEGINNQGRVRSDNIAARQHDGLLFRSEAEITLYKALKATGVYLAPLPVFLRGGKTYHRLEPDFVLLHKGVLLVVEIDGATVHRESPVEAEQRLEGLKHAGVQVHRVRASDCSTAEGAERCAAKILAAIDAYRDLRR